MEENKLNIEVDLISPFAFRQVNDLMKSYLSYLGPVAEASGTIKRKPSGTDLAQSSGSKSARSSSSSSSKSKQNDSRKRAR